MRPRRRQPRYPGAGNVDYAMRGMVDVTRVAAVGTVGMGMIGMVGGLLPLGGH